MFMGTSVCGAMPSFSWNVAMCFLMGVSAGGLLPVVFALVTEVVPRRERGWLLVLIGGVGGAGGYLAASTAASLLEPRFGWRALWLVGLPTGLLLLALQRAIAESPRYLAAEGRTAEARAVAARFGAVLAPADAAPLPAPPIVPRARRRHLVELFRSPYRERSWLLGLAALAWGLVNFGFLTWLPTILRNEGFGAGSVDGLLARSALVAFPGTLLVAWLYARWSSRLTLVLCCGVTAAALGAFAAGAAAGVSTRGVILLVALVLLASGAVNAVLVPYAAETYPTALRATGAGLVAGSGKVGGIVGPQVLTGILALTSAAWLPALLAAAPIGLAATLLRRGGVETRGRRLETIGGEAPGGQGAAVTPARPRS
jgi:putative MFS transporter